MAKRGRPRKVQAEEEEEPAKKYRIEIGCGKEAKLVYERWQALLSSFHQADHIKLFSCALDAVERDMYERKSIGCQCPEPMDPVYDATPQAALQANKTPPPSTVGMTITDSTKLTLLRHLQRGMTVTDRTKLCLLQHIHRNKSPKQVLRSPGRQTQRWKRSLTQSKGGSGHSQVRTRQLT